MAGGINGEEGRIGMLLCSRDGCMGRVGGGARWCWCSAIR
jgi:hypothetical protein